MYPMKFTLIGMALTAALTVTGCSSSATKSPDVADSIHTSLEQRGLKDISVKDDRDKGVVTLGGHVMSDADKAQAEAIAKSMAGGQVVSNEVAVLPPGQESDAKTVNSDLDKGIEKLLDAALVQRGWQKDVKYDVKNGVVKLKGEVDSQARRSEVQKMASVVPYVQQVVNELQVKNQKATSTN